MKHIKQLGRVLDDTIIINYFSGFRVAKFVCPRFLDDQKMIEDNQKLRSPDYQIFLGKYFENNCPYKFLKNVIFTLSFSNKHISFWELKTHCTLYGIKMRATKYMTRTTRFQILVALRQPTFDPNFATLRLTFDKSDASRYNLFHRRDLPLLFGLMDKFRIMGARKVNAH